MLMKAFASEDWPRKVSFTITPGGFLQAPFPSNYNGKVGWESRPEDFQKLIRYARKYLDVVITDEILGEAHRHTNFLTLGLDLNIEGGKLQKTEKMRKRHAELVAVVNTKTGKTHWTGKSYPVQGQETKLVQEASLESHFFRWRGKYVLVLGCHDLTMFSHRSQKNRNPDSSRGRQCERIIRLMDKHKPAIILQHPHSTDHRSTWGTAWNGARLYLPDKSHIYASGIAYYNYQGNRPREDLDKVLRSTGCCSVHVSEVFVNGYRSA